MSSLNLLVSTNFEKVSKTQLKSLLGISYPTALKEYQTILDCLQITNRRYLTIDDLIQFGVLKPKKI